MYTCLGIALYHIIFLGVVELSNEGEQTLLVWQRCIEPWLYSNNA